MNSRRIYTIVVRGVFSVLLLFLINACTESRTEVVSRPVKQTALDVIKSRGKLIVITDYNSTSYFLYRGRPLGFNYEILKAFADHLGVGLNVGISTTYDNTISCLSHNGCDLVALDFSSTKEMKLQFYYTEPVYSSKPVLVQHKKGMQENLSKSGLNLKPIRNPGFLAGKEVVIPKGSPFRKLLLQHSEESADTIRISESTEYKTEQLIHDVAAGIIPYTVAFENTARVNQMYYPAIDIGTYMGATQEIVWAVSRSAPDLLKEFNTWLIRFKKTKKYNGIYEKYFMSNRIQRIRGSKMYSVRNGQISPYDEHFKKYAPLIGWDWRLVAAISYHESRFHPDTVAWSGAAGIMQLMPWVMEEYGITSESPVELQIRAGVKYLGSIEKQFVEMVPDKEERIKFVLAAYNVGIAHVFDARRLAKKYNKRDDVWVNETDSFILKKAYPKYYHDKLAFYGYCRGDQAFDFVKEICEMYELYKNVIRN